MSDRVATTRSTASRAGHPLDVVLGEGRERIVNGDDELLVGLRDRHDPVLAREWPRQRAGDDVEVELEGVDPHEPQAGERGERPAYLRLGSQTELDDGLHDR